MDLSGLASWCAENLGKAERGAFAAGRYVVAFSHGWPGVPIDEVGELMGRALSGAGLRPVGSYASEEAGVWAAVLPTGDDPAGTARDAAVLVWKQYAWSRRYEAQGVTIPDALRDRGQGLEALLEG